MTEDPQNLIDRGFAKRYPDGSVRWCSNIYGRRAGTFITRPSNAGRRKGIPNLTRMISSLQRQLVHDMGRGKNTNHLLNAMVELRLYIEESRGYQ